MTVHAHEVAQQACMRACGSAGQNQRGALEGLEEAPALQLRERRKHACGLVARQESARSALEGLEEAPALRQLVTGLARQRVAQLPAQAMGRRRAHQHAHARQRKVHLPARRRSQPLIFCLPKLLDSHACDEMTVQHSFHVAHLEHSLLSIYTGTPEPCQPRSAPCHVKGGKEAGTQRTHLVVWLSRNSVAMSSAPPMAAHSRPMPMMAQAASGLVTCQSPKGQHSMLMHLCACMQGFPCEPAMKW